MVIVRLLAWGICKSHYFFLSLNLHSTSARKLFINYKGINALSAFTVLTKQVIVLEC